ncbi:helix-turn-helix domain-containing protein [Streptomyces sp. NPDC048337]|uniref:AraC-like ligand-binding domain-containing protein n=1 Tax=Streptomyces sp. NPDC048337 TaxID=3365535 RepID=UPI00371F3645
MGSLNASAEAVSGTDRFDWFCETVSSDLLPVSVSSRHTTDFRASIADLELGDLRLSTFAFSPVQARRTAAHVRQGDPEHYQLTLVKHGVFNSSQQRNESVITGDMVLIDTSYPAQNHTTSADGRVEAVMLQIPRAALPLQPDRVEGLLARRIRADRGTGAILGGFLDTVLTHSAGCRPSELAAMGAVARDLTAACLAQQLGSPEEAPAEARAQAMLQRVTRFIDTNLGDPELTPRAVADRHNISLRCLYTLFEDQPMSVAAAIRQGRLQRAFDDLARPELSTRPVRTIALRWGFSSATVFSRAFRETYGMTPTEHRAAASAGR